MKYSQHLVISQWLLQEYLFHIIAQHYANDGRTNIQQVGFFGVCGILMMKKTCIQRFQQLFNEWTKTSTKTHIHVITYIQCCHLTSVVWLQTVSNTLRSLQGLWNYFFLVHTVFLQKYIISLYFWPVKHCKWIIYSLNPLKQLPNPLPIYQKHFLNMKK